MASNGSSSKSTRKHTTQACDECKRRKSKCNGQQPCARCMTSESDCQYSGVDGRAQRRMLRRMLRQQRESQPNVHHSATKQNNLQSPLPDTSGLPSSRPAPLTITDDLELLSQPNVPASPSGSQQIEQDLSLGSTYVFLKRACTHLSVLGKTHPREVTREQENADIGPANSLLIMPGRHQATQYIDCFFSHMNATYRYLLRDKINHLLELNYQDQMAHISDDASLALFLSVLACGCIWIASWKGHDLSGCRARASSLLRGAEEKLRKATTILPPSMTSLQANFAYCQALVACHRYDSAWLALGQTIRLCQIIGMGKRRAGLTPREEFEWRGLFWSIFMLDRYLGLFLDRPFGINARDISVALPRELPVGVDHQIGTEERDLVPGTVAHIKILQIAGCAMASLNSANGISQADQEQLIPAFEAKIADWERETPDFFHSDQSKVQGAFYSVPWLFKRQQRTVRSAYYLTQMLLYRGSLLHDFTKKTPNSLLSATPQLSAYSRKCRDAAMSMAELAAEFTRDNTCNPSFWGTSHSIFCAVAILVVSCLLFDDRVRLEPVIEGAMKAHLAMTVSSSPGRQRLLEVQNSSGAAYARFPADLAQDSHSMAQDILHEATAPAGSERICDGAIDIEIIAPRPQNQQQLVPADMTSQDAALLQSLQMQAMFGNASMNDESTEESQAQSQLHMDSFGEFQSELQKMMDIGFDKAMYNNDLNSFF
ncbi:hypothetical protein NM208_g9546 [Fusarium decemcellulare]|uniref:Uncharacterized protein n=1 Tax=Fusarium decemcellulare TaxID=57161 RepID=A0ACC1S149_9HYPO|nr:hypothetical protein NM208_g9546 [Fusarium decemcellulare]